MNEVDVLKLFYDEMTLRGVTRDKVFISIEEPSAAMLTQKSGQPASLETVQKLTDICIANEWLERTTADPNYKYLSLTDAGLQIILSSLYT